ncbi:putative J domain-containing protein C63.13 [Hypsizygus marmoreus]|uniref:J domain-containing protein C63.13 n=1 Tax=Hypsizygus marmoreus TaxID=39966 RepID=A0A369K2J5_HYPMA|nr:putative J domain-containing protein C63.13 [Hypsizygus marmoreus]
MSKFPDYYQLLNIQQTATHDEIRQAYKKESLRTHPDRLVNASPTEKRLATERFQAVADAYYVLSDPTRRKEYDTLYASHTSDRTNDPSSSSSFFSQFAGMFGGAGARTGNGGAPPAPGQRPDPEGVFADVFEELLRPEVERHAHWWSYAGAVCGGGVGFIVANVPGLMLGAYAGNRLGAIRDAKGKSVAAVFNELGGSQKAEILRALAAKVLGSAL